MKANKQAEERSGLSPACGRERAEEVLAAEPESFLCSSSVVLDSLTGIRAAAAGTWLLAGRFCNAKQIEADDIKRSIQQARAMVSMLPSLMASKQKSTQKFPNESPKHKLDISAAMTG